MAILIYANNRDITNWVDALKKEDKNIDIRIYPNIGNIDDIIFALTWPFPQGFFSEFKNLKTICSIGAGVNHILKDPTIKDYINIVKLVDKNLTQNMWEYCLGAVTYYTMQFNKYNELQNKKIWKEYIPNNFKNTTIGIMGLGSIGKDIAIKFEQIGFKIKGYSNSKKDIPNIKTYCNDDLIEDFLDDIDILISILPLTSKTKYIFNNKFFKSMKKGSYFINVGRGEQVVENDLINNLNNNHLAGAFLDVFEQEPLEKNHPFWNHNKIFITPHIASITNPYSVASQIITNYYNTTNRYPLQNTINKKNGY